LEPAVARRKGRGTLNRRVNRACICALLRPSRENSVPRAPGRKDV
jgi:hypothetical protein